MSGAKHTPGPWEARAGESSHVCVYQSGTNHNVSVGSTKADAILIAAAPQLLEAIKSALFAVTADADNNDGKVDRMAVAALCRAALAAAGVQS